MTKHQSRNRWFINIAIALVAMLTFSQMAIAQDSTPTAAEMEGDALVRSMDPSALPEGWVLPEQIGHVTNYLVHEWYQNETKGEQVRADEWGISFSINDANLDLNTSLAAVDDYVAQELMCSTSPRSTRKLRDQRSVK
ncbi:MAG: hypothetical protein R2839_04895 [Thermomicrobiales bacterium]